MFVHRDKLRHLSHWHHRLQSLHPGGNSLSKTMPEKLPKRLKFLYLNDNLFNGTIPQLSNLTDLEELALHNNSLHGSIPSELGSCSSLTYAYLGFNALSGTVPTSLANLTNLKGLMLSQNNLSGSLPERLSSLNQLEYAYFGQNYFSGSIPPVMVSGWKSATVIDFGSNELGGPIPYELALCPKLEILDLYNNSLVRALTA